MLDEMLIAGELQEPSKKVQLNHCCILSSHAAQSRQLCRRHVLYMRLLFGELDPNGRQRG